MSKGVENNSSNNKIDFELCNKGEAVQQYSDGNSLSSVHETKNGQGAALSPRTAKHFEEYYLDELLKF